MHLRCTHHNELQYSIDSVVQHRHSNILVWFNTWPKITAPWTIRNNGKSETLAKGGPWHINIVVVHSSVSNNYCFAMNTGILNSTKTHFFTLEYSFSKPVITIPRKNTPTNQSKTIKSQSLGLEPAYWRFRKETAFHNQNFKLAPS